MASTKTFTLHRWSEWKQRRNMDRRAPGWYPPALRWWILAATTLLCWIFIAVLQWFLHKSQSEGGVIFAPDINNLPLRRSFVYLYLPTIIAIIFSIFIVWIDHDAKRFEPFRQILKEGGGLAEDSVLLQYPFDFMPFVPFVAARRGHWLVFWSSLSTVLVNFGVVPLQAGIFSTKTVIRASSPEFAISDQYMPASIQEGSLTLSYAQSAYAIMELNETLPAYMTQNYTLKPFIGKTREPFANVNGTWTANTTMYSLSLQCEPGQEGIKRFSDTQKQQGFNSSFGCFTTGDVINDNVVGESRNPRNPASAKVKMFSAKFMGQYVEHDNFYGRVSNIFPNLENRCPGRGDGAFFATFTRNKNQKTDPPNNVTAIFCRPSYHEQDVEATIDATTRRPTEIVLHGAQRELMMGILNATVFEETLASGQRQILVRENGLPGTMVPRYLEQVADSDLTPWVDDISDSTLPPMAAMAVMASRDRMSDLLEYDGLVKAYTLVYQLLFARAVNDILRTDFSTTTRDITGYQSENTGAVAMEPVFTYLVEGLLAIVSISAIAMIYIGYTGRPSGKLSDDPGPISTIMSMVADDSGLLRNFSSLEGASKEVFRRTAGKMRYHIGREADCHATNVSVESMAQQQPLLNTQDSEQQEAAASIEMHRPMVFRFFTAVPFISLFATLMLALAILFHRARLSGLPLPSRSRIVQNVVAEYLPTTIATLIEPIWILISRLLCVLQPLEELQSLRATTPSPLALAYSSLPPQLIAFKAARNKHVILTILCVMVLLSNVLATAFAGLFIRDFVPIAREVRFSAPYRGLFVSINGSIGPPIDHTKLSWQLRSGAYRGGLGEDHFLIAESNSTRNTSLPSWTDNYAAYVPFRSSDAHDSGQIYQARTRYFSVEPNCKSNEFGVDYRFMFGYGLRENRTKLNITNESIGVVTCYPPEASWFGAGLSQSVDQMAYEKSCRTGKLAAELLTSLEAHVNDTQAAKSACLSSAVIGWARSSLNDCSTNSTEPQTRARSNNTMLVTCQPRMRTGLATVRVNAAGVLQEPAGDLEPDLDPEYTALEKYFTSGPDTLIQQSNLFIMRSSKSIWHNDTYASESLQYFMNRAAGHQRLTDPHEPLPSFDDVIEPLSNAYRRLFAIWLGVNHELLFEPTVGDAEHVQGAVITLEERLLFVTPLFVISEVILVMYIITSIILYARRPGRYLVRRPTSVAAIIALFAASTAVKDLQGTSHLKNEEREKLLLNMACHYGYGHYTGEDGIDHIGIERKPYVKPLHEAAASRDRAEIEMKPLASIAMKKDQKSVRYTALEQVYKNPQSMTPLEEVNPGEGGQSV